MTSQNPQLETLDMDPDTSGDCAMAASCSAGAIGTTLRLRFGRLRVVNAYGPETQALPVPLVTEYWNGARFVVNSDDGDGATACSLLVQAIVDLQAGSSLGTPIVVGGGTSTGSVAWTAASDFLFNGGDAGLVFSAPGAGCRGRAVIAV